MSSPAGDPHAGVPAQARRRGVRATHLIGIEDVSPGWVLLYAGTFFVQFVCALVRGMLAYCLLAVVFAIMGWSTAPVDPIAYVIGYGPLVLSLATLILPLGGWWWQQQAGGRAPSQRERFIYEDAFATLQAHEPALRAPRRWFVLDTSEPNAAAYADTLMLTRGLLESVYLPGVLAHELGHLNSSDARLTAALYRMTTPPRREARRGLRTIALVVSGGIGVWLTRAPWGAYWRAREHHADRYAARLGQGENLARFLDVYALENDLPQPFMWLTEVSHPWTEHRIDSLEHYEP
ncbi:MAG TPA: M48 family metalloprotease [Solirubrobacteraceae bacterium]|nr:M48 family metalloprotease [Solirubrobacteraceae bacterium]